LEALLLTQSLINHPAQLSVAELPRLLGADLKDFGEIDAIERAVGELESSGLVHRSGALVTPTLSALRADLLIGGRVANQSWLNSYADELRSGSVFEP
jgi:hypothetical protein